MPEPDHTTYALGRVEAKVDILLQRTDGYEVRLRAVEKKQNWLAGVGAAVTLFVGKLSFQAHGLS